MKQTKITYSIISIISILFVLTLTGCTSLQQKYQALFQDPVAEDYLVKMLDAVDKNDINAAEQLFSSKYVSKEDIENIMDTTDRLWDGGSYTHNITYSEFKTDCYNGITVTINKRKYEVVTQDHTYFVDITYVDGEGLVGFNLSR